MYKPEMKTSASKRIKVKKKPPIKAKSKSPNGTDKSSNAVRPAAPGSYKKIICGNVNILENIINSGNLVVIILDNKGEIFSFNKKAERFFNINKKDINVEFFNYKSWSIYDPSHIKPNRSDNLHAAVKKLGGPILNKELLIAREDKDTSAVVFNSFPLWDDDGKFNGSIHSIQDITNQLKSKRALTTYRQIVETAPVGIFDIDYATKKITNVNDAMCKITGYTRNELLSIDGLRILSEEGKKKFAARQKKIGKNIPPEEVVEYELMKKDGSLVWCEAHIKYIFEKGKLAKANIIILDITDKKLSEIELKDSVEVYEELFEAESDAIFLIDNEYGKLIKANHAAEVLYGYTLNEIYKLRNVELSAQEDETKRVTSQTPVIKDNVVLIPLRYHKKKDGTVFPVEITGRFFNYKGRPVHIAAIRDITHRIEEEERKKDQLERIKKQNNVIAEIALNNDVKEGSLVPAVSFLLEKVTNTLNIERASIWELSAGFDEIICTDLFEKSKSLHASGIRIAEKEVPNYFKAFKSGKIIDASDALNDPRTSEFKKNYLLPLGINSMLDIPIIASGNLIGVICVEHTGDKRIWNDDEINFVKQIADQYAQVLLNSEKAAVKQSLMESEERLKFALSATNHAIWEWLPEKEVLYWSNEYLTMLGYSENEIYPSIKNWESLLHPDHKAEALEKFRKCNHNESDIYYNETLFKTKSGSFKWILVTGKVIKRNRDGSIARMIGTHADITERKQTEEALLIKDSAIASASSAIAISDIKGNINYVNDSLLKLWRYNNYSEAVGKNASEFWADKEKVMNVIIELNSRDRWNGEMLALRKDRTTFLAEVSANVIKDKYGKRVGMMSSILDVTEQKEILESLKYRMEFESIINQISNNLINTTDYNIDRELNEALMEIGRFTDVDRAYIFKLYDNLNKMDNTHEWCEKDIEPFLDSLKNLNVADFPIVHKMISEFTEVYIERISDLPDNSSEKMEFEREGIKSLLLVPMKSAGSIIGFLGLDSVKEEKKWDVNTIALVKLIGEMFSNAIEKARYDKELNSANQRLNDIIELIPDATFVIDQNKKVVAWNRAIEILSGVLKQDIIGKGDFEYALPFFKKRQPILIDLLDEGIENFARYYKYIKRSGDKIYAESYLENVNNKNIHLWGVAAPLYDKDGVRFGSIEVIKDISDLKKKETELIESEERFRIVLEQTGIIVYDINKEKNYISREGAIESILGYSKEEYNNLTEAEWMSLVHPDDRAETINIEQEAVKNGAKFDSIFRVRRKDGKYVFIEESGVVKKNEEGGLSRILGSMKDVTEKINYQNALKANEERLRLALEGATDGIWDLNLQTQQLYLSPQYYRILEYEPGEFEPSMDSWRGLMHPDDLSKIENGIIAGIKNHNSHYLVEFRMKTKSGIWKWISARGKLVEYDKNNKPLRLSGTITDITERMIADIALRESEERYQLLANTSPVGIFRTDPEGNTIYVNPKWCELTGFTIKEALGNLWLKAVHPDDIRELTTNWEKAVSAREISTAEYRLISKQGKTKWVIGQAVPLKSDDKKFLGYVGTILDITERKIAEMALIENYRRQKLVQQSLPLIFYSTEAKPPFRNKWFDGDVIKLTGFTPHYFTSSETAWSDRLHDDDKETIINQYNSIIQKGNINLVYRWKCKDGSVKWFNDQIVLIKDENGNPQEVIGIWIDITEQKIAEEALRQSEVRWQFAIEGSGDGLWDWNVKSNEVFFTKQWKEMLGYAENEITNTFGEWERLLHPEDKKSTIRSLNNYLNGDTPLYSSEHRLLCKDGNYKWVLDRGKTVEFAEDGSPLRIIGTHTDITDRKLKEEIIRQSEEKFRTFIEQSTNGLIITDCDGRISEWNPAQEKITGIKKENAIGRFLSDIQYDSTVPEKKADSYKEMIKSMVLKALKEKEAPFLNKPVELEMIGRGGERITIIQNAFIISGQEKNSIGAIISDITELKKSQQALVEIEFKFKELVETMPNGFYRSSHEGKFEIVNPALVKILGYDSKEELMNIDIMTDLYPVIEERNEMQVINPEFIDQTEVYRLKKKDGSIIWVEDNARYIKDETGKILYHEGILRDITDKKLADEKIKAINSELKKNLSITSALLEAIPTPVFFKDKEGKYLGCNRAFTDQLGVASEDLKGKTVFELWPSDQARKYHEKDLELLTKPELQVYEFNITDKNGEVRDTVYAKNVFIDEEGNPAGIVGAYIDITDRKKAEAAIRKSEEKYRTLFSNSALAVGIRSLGGEYIEFNDSYARMVGYTQAELSKMKTQDYTHPDDVEISLNNMSKIAAGECEIVRYQKRYIGRDGNIIWGNICLQPLKEEGNITAILGTVVDITSSKLAEEALKESERRLSLAMEGTQIGLWDHYFKTNKVYRNENWAKMLGYSLEEVSDELDFWKNHIHPDDYNSTIAQAEDHEKGKTPFFKVEHRLRCKNGEYKWILNWGRISEFDDFGNPVRSTGIHMDIDDRVRAREQLELSEERYRLLVEHSPDGIAVHKDGKIIFVNPAVQKFLGATSADQLIGMPLLEFVHPDYKQIVIDRVTEMARSNKPADMMEEKFMRMDGTYMDVEVISMPVKFGGEHVFQVVFRDITYRKKAEEALKASEEQFRLLFENSPVGIAVADYSGNIIALNDAMLRPGNYTVGDTEVMGNVMNLLCDKEKHFEVMSVFKEHGYINDFPVQLKKKDGGFYDALLSLIPVKFKGESCIQAIVVDISQQKKQEEEIRLINQELTILNKIISTSIKASSFEEVFDNLITDVLEYAGLEGGTICSVTQNQHLKLIAHRGTSRETIYDLTNNEIKVGECLCGNCALTQEPLILWDREAVLEYSTRESHRNEQLQFHAAFPILVQNECLGVLCVFTRTEEKISDRKLKFIEIVTAQTAVVLEKIQLYNKVQSQAEQLEIKVKQRTADLEASNKELESFSYSVSHDLRAPLRAIDGFSMALYEDYDKLLDDQAKTYLNRIRINSQKMAILIDDLLGMARVTRQSIELETINLSHIFHEVFKELTEFQQNRHILFKVEHEMVDNVDRQLFKICIQNILENALKFTSLNTETKIEVGAIQLVDKKTYFVSDNGVGFDMKYYSKLFGVFQRLHTQNEFPGTGVGLAIAQKIITKHNGKIWAESTLGDGATFYFTLNDFSK